MYFRFGQFRAGLGHGPPARAGRSATRRALLLAAASFPAFAVTALAQQARKVYRIGFLWDSPTVWPHALASFREGLRKLGWVEGRNIVFEYRWAEGRFDRLDDLAQDLVRLKVDIIVAPSTVYTEAAKRATSAIPVIFLSHADPVGSGHVASLARPGGNITGLTIVMSETSVKALEVLKRAVPGLASVAVLWDPATPSHQPALKALEVAARTLGVRLQSLAVRRAAEFEGAFTAIARERSGGVLVLSTPLFMGAPKQLAELALKHKLPTMFGPSEHAEAGGLMSFGPDRPDTFYRGADYVDKILKGVRPADLPVQQATKFELVINLKTAKAIGLTIPQSLLVQADRVIE
ncbi:MAG: ABC transporter substrate-binding protein [Betaproteobacteria bacterium]|nr:ABC transporter substrate-binding protein [Betaproteobacteria bacterium]